MKNRDSKKCPKCNEIKDISSFYKNKNRYGGIKSWCKACDAVHKKDYIKENKEKITQNRKAYYAENGEEERANDKIRRKLWEDFHHKNGEVYCKFCDSIKKIDQFVPSALGRKNPKCQDCYTQYNQSRKIIDKERDQKRYENKIICDKVYCKFCDTHHNVNNFTRSELGRKNPKCKSCTAIHSKEYYDLNGVKIKQYYIDNKDILLEKHKKYNSENKEKINSRIRERSKTDLVFKMRKYISIIIWRALKNRNGSKNENSVWDYIPYDSPAAFVKHIEEQFSLPENLDYDGKVWMTWDNHGGIRSKNIRSK